MNDQSRMMIPIRVKPVLQYGFKCSAYSWALYMLLDSVKATTAPPAKWLVVIMIALVVKSVLGLLRSLLHHSLSEEGLSICFLSIPIRVVSWNRIRHAIYMHAWIHTETRVDYGQIIVVTFSGCPKFFYETDSLYRYLPRHPIGATCIWLPPHDVSRYTEAFHSYFPMLERQSQKSAERIKESRRLRKTNT